MVSGRPPDGIDVDHIPAELKQRPQWVTWIRARGTKLPCNPHTGKVDDATNPATWASFAQACAAARTFTHAGIGYAFSPDDPYVGIDLDDCITDDGTLKPPAQAIIATLQSYTEVSPSGKGVKLWVIGSIPENVGVTPLGDGMTIELYQAKRFFTVTGQRLAGTPPGIGAVTGELDDLYQQLRPAPTPERPPQLPTATPDDQHLRRYVLGALERAHQHMLAVGEGQRHDTRRDEAFALAGYLWTGVITHDDIFTALAVNFGPDRRGAEQTIWSSIAAGEQAPRAIPPPRATFAPRPEDVITIDDIRPLAVDGEVVTLKRGDFERLWAAAARATQLERELEQVRERNRFVTQTAGAENIGAASKRLTFIELKKELDRVPLEERERGEWVRIRPAYMAACTGQDDSTVSRHLGEFEQAGYIEREVRRTRDPETGAWSSETFAPARVDLSDPTQVVLPSKPRGRQACKQCGSEQLVREVKVYCATCRHVQAHTVELVNPPEAELQTASQEELPSAGQSEGLNCNVQHTEKTVDLFCELQFAIQADHPSSGQPDAEGLPCNMHHTKRTDDSACELQTAMQEAPESGVNTGLQAVSWPAVWIARRTTVAERRQADDAREAACWRYLQQGRLNTATLHAGGMHDLERRKHLIEQLEQQAGRRSGSDRGPGPEP